MYKNKSKEEKKIYTEKLKKKKNTYVVERHVLLNI